MATRQPISRRWPVAAALALCLAPLAAAPGCSSARGVPSGASLVTEATVKSSFQAPADGMLWIFRTASRGSRGQLHYSGPIGAGQVLVIDPSMNKATIDGRELDLVLPGGDVLYQAYFRADRSVRRILEDRPAGGNVIDADTGRPLDINNGPRGNESGADPNADSPQ